ncbi:hypothetical protein HZ326_27386 [Fusarium oxysporum f. sp. albedinis]|nr:hypothetical protein HZ326_27386 [Fusarium oxysporum f. sp. albedinis]
MRSKKRLTFLCFIERSRGLSGLYRNLSSNGYSEVVKMLLEKGADTAATNNDGWTPLLEASRYAALEEEDLLQVWTLNGRLGLKNINGYNIRGPLGGRDSDQLVKNRPSSIENVGGLMITEDGTTAVVSLS